MKHLKDNRDLFNIEQLPPKLKRKNFDIAKEYVCTDLSLKQVGTKYGLSPVITRQTVLNVLSLLKS